MQNVAPVFPISIARARFARKEYVSRKMKRKTADHDAEEPHRYAQNAKKTRIVRRVIVHLESACNQGLHTNKRKHNLRLASCSNCLVLRAGRAKLEVFVWREYVFEADCLMQTFPCAL